jgi:hypothetical protein
VTATLEIEAGVAAGVPEDSQATVSENCKTVKFKTQGFEAS